MEATPMWQQICILVYYVRPSKLFFKNMLCVLLGRQISGSGNGEEFFVETIFSSQIRGPQAVSDGP